MHADSCKDASLSARSFAILKVASSPPTSSSEAICRRAASNDSSSSLRSAVAADSSPESFEFSEIASDNSVASFECSEIAFDSSVESFEFSEAASDRAAVSVDVSPSAAINRSSKAAYFASAAAACCELDFSAFRVVDFRAASSASTHDLSRSASSFWRRNTSRSFSASPSRLWSLAVRFSRASCARCTVSSSSLSEASCSP